VRVPLEDRERHVLNVSHIAVETRTFEKVVFAQTIALRQTDLRECQGGGIPTEPEGRADVEGKMWHAPLCDRPALFRFQSPTVDSPLRF
jgi:hypothetical protein